MLNRMRRRYCRSVGFPSRPCGFQSAKRMVQAKRFGNLGRCERAQAFAMRILLPLALGWNEGLSAEAAKR